MALVSSRGYPNCASWMTSYGYADHMFFKWSNDYSSYDSLPDYFKHWWANHLDSVLQWYGLCQRGWNAEMVWNFLALTERQMFFVQPTKPTRPPPRRFLDGMQPAGSMMPDYGFGLPDRRVGFFQDVDRTDEEEGGLQDMPWAPGALGDRKRWIVEDDEGNRRIAHSDANAMRHFLRHGTHIMPNGYW